MLWDSLHIGSNQNHVWFKGHKQKIESGLVFFWAELGEVTRSLFDLEWRGCLTIDPGWYILKTTGEAEISCLQRLSDHSGYHWFEQSFNLSPSHKWMSAEILPVLSVLLHTLAWTQPFSCCSSWQSHAAVTTQKLWYAAFWKCVCFFHSLSAAQLPCTSDTRVDLWYKCWLKDT